jgi:hypothetical protein
MVGKEIVVPVTPNIDTETNSNKLIANTHSIENGYGRERECGISNKVSLSSVTK